MVKCTGSWLCKVQVCAFVWQQTAHTHETMNISPNFDTLTCSYQLLLKRCWNVAHCLMPTGWSLQQPWRFQRACLTAHPMNHNQNWLHNHQVQTISFFLLCSSIRAHNDCFGFHGICYMELRLKLNLMEIFLRTQVAQKVPGCVLCITWTYTTWIICERCITVKLFVHKQFCMLHSFISTYAHLFYLASDSTKAWFHRNVCHGCGQGIHFIVFFCWAIT